MFWGGGDELMQIICDLFFLSHRYFSQNMCLSEREGKWAVSECYQEVIIPLALCFWVSIYKMVIFSPQKFQAFLINLFKPFWLKEKNEFTYFLHFKFHVPLIYVTFASYRFLGVYVLVFFSLLCAVFVVLVWFFSGFFFFGVLFCLGFFSPIVFQLLSHLFKNSQSMPLPLDIPDFHSVMNSFDHQEHILI